MARNLNGFGPYFFLDATVWDFKGTFAVGIILLTIGERSYGGFRLCVHAFPVYGQVIGEKVGVSVHGHCCGFVSCDSLYNCDRHSCMCGKADCRVAQIVQSQAW